MIFTEYLESLAEEHTLIHHSKDECHFSDMTTDYPAKLVRKMNYPLVAVDTEGFSISGGSGQYLIGDQFNIYFLTHVRDTGSYSEIRKAFDLTRQIMIDFIARFSRDKKKMVKAVARIDLAQAEGFPVFFKDMALYGWSLSVLCPQPLNDKLCTNNFIL